VQCSAVQCSAVQCSAGSDNGNGRKSSVEGVHTLNKFLSPGNVFRENYFITALVCLKKTNFSLTRIQFSIYAIFLFSQNIVTLIWRQLFERNWQVNLIYRFSIIWLNIAKVLPDYCPSELTYDGRPAPPDPGQVGDHEGHAAGHCAALAILPGRLSVTGNKSENGASAVQCISAVQCSAVQCSAVVPAARGGRQITRRHCAILISPPCHLHCTALHCTVLHCTALHCTTHWMRTGITKSSRH
jgi:hypothetical protein